MHEPNLAPKGESPLVQFFNTHPVLDGIEDRSYKPAHKVRLFGGVPDPEYDYPSRIPPAVSTQAPV